jgi:hypothetical protein
MLEPKYAALELPFGPSRSLWFRAAMLQHTVKLPHSRQQAVMWYTRFESRYTEFPLLVPNNMWRFSMEFHGCVKASALILHQTFLGHLRYDDEQDVVVAPKQLAQSIATQYGVDVNDMMQQYPHVRPFFRVEGLEIPENIQVAVRNLAIKGEADVKREGL